MTVHRWCSTSTRVCAVTAPFQSTSVVFNVFAEGSQIQTYTILLDSLTSPVATGGFGYLRPPKQSSLDPPNKDLRPPKQRP